jgi:tRNA (mo5U34)-methyltransferase
MQFSGPKDIRDLAAAAVLFRDRLDQLKSVRRSPEFEWYPYNSFGVLPVLIPMLQDERRDLVALAGPGPVLDIGCGDGDFSFFFESLGCRVMSIDHPATNYNRTLGFRTLRAALGSSVELDVSDVDAGLDLRGRTFGLGLCLGVLYHLKNPFGFLENLARHVRYCLLSTRIAQVTVRGTAMAEEPIAYLLNPSEANNDPTNYWIFSEAGLRRILDRTGWDLCDYATTGFERGSDPARGDRDQRAYCMIRSKLADAWLDADLDGGWHAMENDSWRWTERVFTVRLKRTVSATPTLRFRFTLPDAIVRKIGPVRIQAAVDGSCLAGCEYASSGEHTYTQPIPATAVTNDSVSIRFELDKALQPAEADGRELGVQVKFWSYEDPVPRALSPITISD